MSPASHAEPSTALVDDAQRLIDDGRAVEAIDLLHRANEEHADPEVERLLAVARHRAAREVVPASAHQEWPVPVPDLEPPGEPRIPQLAPSELTADAVRRAILTHGCVHVPGLLSAEQARTFREGIDHVLELRARNQASDNPFQRHGSWLASLPLSQDDAIRLARPWVAGDGGILACDSPRLLEMVLSTYEALGLRDLITEYLGERPILSANKATLRRARLEGNTQWHQDGAFLGSQEGIRAINVWVTLTDCGVDAPSMDIVPKRFDAVQETGTGGAIFDWAVGDETVERLSHDAPPVRPRYQAGDAMLFDDMLLHRTALDPSMTRTRHAIESWFFAPTNYPDGQVPLLW